MSKIKKAAMLVVAVSLAFSVVAYAATVVQHEGIVDPNPAHDGAHLTDYVKTSYYVRAGVNDNNTTVILPYSTLPANALITKAMLYVSTAATGDNTSATGLKIATTGAAPVNILNTSTAATIGTLGAHELTIYDNATLGGTIRTTGTRPEQLKLTLTNTRLTALTMKIYVWYVITK